MSVVFELYTEEAKRAIFFARYEAARRGSKEISPEDLLLGICRDQHSRPNRLIGLQSKYEHFIHVFGVEDVVERQNTDLPLNDAAKRALAYAAEEAQQLAENWIDSGHLLLGLLREKSSTVDALQAEAITLESWRRMMSADHRNAPQGPFSAWQRTVFTSTADSPRPQEVQPNPERRFTFRWWQSLIVALPLGLAVIWFRC